MAPEVPPLQVVENVRGMYADRMTVSRPEYESRMSAMGALMEFHLDFVNKADRLFPDDLQNGIYVPLEFAFTALVIRLARPVVVEATSSAQQWDAALTVIGEPITEPDLKGADALYRASPVDYIPDPGPEDFL